MVPAASAARKLQPYPMWYEPEQGLYFQAGMSLKQEV
jgi:hypothetical protein